MTNLRERRRLSISCTILHDKLARASQVVDLLHNLFLLAELEVVVLELALQPLDGVVDARLAAVALQVALRLRQRVILTAI